MNSPDHTKGHAEPGRTIGSHFEPGPLSPVDCQVADDGWTLVFVKDLRHPPEKVWHAITDPASLERWSPFTTDRALDTAGDAVLTMIDNDNPLETKATVHRADRPTLLEYTWGTDVLRWELSPLGAGTRLTLRHTVQDHDWVPKVAAGWHLCLVVADRLLNDDPIPPIRGNEAREYGWEALHDAYAAELGMSGSGWPEDSRATKPE